MNIFAFYADHVRAAVRALAERGHLPAGLDLDRVVVEPPRDPSHGDLATNVAMVLAKDAKTKPRDLAERLAVELQTAPHVAAVTVAGPGFINLTLALTLWPQVLAAAIATGTRFGAADLGRREPVNVEYVSANPTGPMHVGHGRGAVFGDALANLLSFVGYAVTREYYINDAGAQVDVLARSAHLRYREALGEAVGAIPEGLYPGDYLVPVGQALAARYGSSLRDRPEADWLPVVRAATIEAMMAAIRDDLASLNIRHDVFFSERSLVTGAVDLVAATIATLRAAEQIYEGRLPPPKGVPPDDWEDREQTLFRATAFGDDVDRPLMKSDGTYTYFASDIAYHHNKFERGFHNLVDVWGADHGGYVKRMQAAVTAISGGQAALDVKLCQLVRLFRNGEPVRMSKRSGDFVTLREVVDEVGRDAVRFMMLYRKNDAVLDFDLIKVIEQSRDNPVFYVQYAHARCQSVFRNASEIIPSVDVSREAAAVADLARLVDPGEIDIIKQIAIWPRIVEQAAVHHEPHRVAFFLYELASAFHAQWNRGKDVPYLRFIIENDPLMTSARLSLVHGVAAVLAAGLDILGVEPVMEMR